jgi:hypothetical protein
MLPLQVKRYLVTGSMLYATWTAWTCPCANYLECHKTQFLLATGVPIALAVFGDFV